MTTPSTAPSYLTSRHSRRRQLKNGVRYQPEPDSPILASSRLVVSIAAHIDGEVKAFTGLLFFFVIGSPDTYLSRRRRFRRLPQKCNQPFGKVLVVGKRLAMFAPRENQVHVTRKFVRCAKDFFFRAQRFSCPGIALGALDRADRRVDRSQKLRQFRKSVCFVQSSQQLG